ncbi:hypothetical protein Fmac_015533 [Flemingia macrophylla]|uniref:Cyclic nucleotide-binding domain-containing protein n=1 Tax=Flemingia macrophylla TaxID=520843 RepID=A0ABD1MET4_9FABA
MANFEENGELLSETHAPQNELENSSLRKVVSRTKSASISIPMEQYERETSLVRHTSPLLSVRKSPLIHMSGPLYATNGTENLLHQSTAVKGNKVVESKTENFSSLEMTGENHGNNNYDRKNEHLLRSGLLGMCNDPYCTTCPTYFKASSMPKLPKASSIFDPQFHFQGSLYGDAKGFGTKLASLCYSYVPGVINPHTRVVQLWNKFLAIFCIVAIFVDPLFLYLIHVQKFRLAYVSPESRVVGAGDLVDHPKKIAPHYLQGYFLLDLFVVFPLPQRVNQCLRDACGSSHIERCMRVIDCGHGHTRNNQSDQISALWSNNSNAIACLDPSLRAFNYGIYVTSVPLTIQTSVVNKYIYSLFWGFQIFFNVTYRRLEKQLRGRDVEQWMSHRRLPEDLRRKVRQAERYNWSATKGVNEEMLLENLPEDLQRDIRRHLFKFVKKVRIFTLMDEPILDAICERLRQKTYIKGGIILSQGGPVEKMIFIVRGKLESIGEDRIRIPLSEGDVCGEELLTWYLEHSSVSTDGKKVRLPGQRLLSNRTVKCLTNLEAFSLQAEDLEEVTTLFMRFLRNLRVQGSLRDLLRRGIGQKDTTRVKLPISQDPSSYDISCGVHVSTHTPVTCRVSIARDVFRFHVFWCLHAQSPSHRPFPHPPAISAVASSPVPKSAT